MSIASSTPLSLSGNSIIDATLHGYYWLLDGNRTINWTFSDNDYEGMHWNDPLEPGGMIYQVSQIFEVISSYINVSFNYLGYYDDATTSASVGSDINISMSAELFSSTNTLAMAFFPDTKRDIYYKGAAGDVYINIDSEMNNYASYAAGTQGWFVLMHEIGHALGLKHPHDDGGTGRPTYEDLGIADLDEDWASIMSYSDDYGFTNLAYDPATPMIFDVIALQHLYGENSTDTAGDDIHELLKTNYYTTLWDSGGSDVLDAHSRWEPWKIVLGAGDSSFGYAMPASEIYLDSPMTLYWLKGEYEVVWGTYYDDTIIGNDLRNTLYGGNGDDYLDGKGGIDTASFEGSVSDFFLARGTERDIIVGIDGVDELVSIERLYFSDGEVAIDIDGHAGDTVSVLAVVFGKQAISNKEYVGIGLSLFDYGQTMEQVCDLALRAAGAVTNEQVVGTLYYNLFGSMPSQGDMDLYVGLIEESVYSQASLAVAAAELAGEFGVVDLVGLSNTGIEYEYLWI